MTDNSNITYGLMKCMTDAHTMGIRAAYSLLKDTGYNVILAPLQIENALDQINSENSQKMIVEWVKENNIQRIGISYRLDPHDAVNLVGRLVYLFKKEGLYESSDSLVKNIHFAGLAPACDIIDSEYDGRIKTFRGGESAEETLMVMGIPADEIPTSIIEGCKYDKELLHFGNKVIEKGEFIDLKPFERNIYPEYGTDKDTLQLRLKNNFKDGFQPLIRAHSGPYSPDKTRIQCLEEYESWCRQLANGGYLDILSIGSSQLSQSNFGEVWDNKVNGGGVPVNSEAEFHSIWYAARPMLVRTYSATKNILEMAKMYEKSINISWHALSLWWFDELDGRGPNKLYDNLCDHLNTINYVSKTGKPIETNVPHHFAFRGCDDLTYIVSSFLAAKTAKKYGTKCFVLQNMLNTPRSTWGIQDLAKSRAMLKLIKSLEDDKFKVILQTRTGLDYFKPNIEKAKVQLASSVALMDDIDPYNMYSPDIIHVVSYSEALCLATPEIINESIKITRQALKDYRNLKNQGMTPDTLTEDILFREESLMRDAKLIISAMEKYIDDLYSPEGLYIAFVSGWLPVPELWSDSDEFLMAKLWETKMLNGGVRLMAGDKEMSVDSRINKCVSNIDDAKYILKNKYNKRLVD